MVKVERGTHLYKCLGFGSTVKNARAWQKEDGTEMQRLQQNIKDLVTRFGQFQIAEITKESLTFSLFFFFAV